MGEMKHVDHDLNDLMNSQFSLNEIDALLLPYADENPLLPNELVQNLAFEEEKPLKIEEDQPEYRFMKPNPKKVRKDAVEEKSGKEENVTSLPGL